MEEAIHGSAVQTILTTAQRLFSRGAQENESFSVGWAVVKIVYDKRVEDQENKRNERQNWDGILLTFRFSCSLGRNPLFYGT